MFEISPKKKPDIMRIDLNKFNSENAGISSTTEDSAANNSKKPHQEAVTTTPSIPQNTQQTWINPASQQPQYTQQPVQSKPNRKKAIIVGILAAILLLFAFSCSSMCTSRTPTNVNTSNTSSNTPAITTEAKDNRTIEIKNFEATSSENDIVHVKLAVKLHNDNPSVWSGKETMKAVASDGSQIKEIEFAIPNIPSHEYGDVVAEFDLPRSDFERLSKIVSTDKAQYKKVEYNCLEDVRHAIETWAPEVAVPSPPEPAAPVMQVNDDWAVWDENKAPNYALETGPAQIGDIPPAGTIIYGDLDHLGRTTAAVGNITKALRDAGSANGHDDFGADDDPSGWPAHNWQADIITPTGKNYHGFFWNRSHLIADSLGGQAIKRNAITGTRMQNVGANNGDDAGGMAYCEVRARNWLDSHPDGTLYYRAEPMYVGDELIPRAVIVDMKSSDNTIDKRIIVYNAAKGYDIDYSGRDSNVTPVAGSQPEAPVQSETAPAPVQEESTPAPAPTQEVTATPAPIQENSQMVIVTKTGKKYHFSSSCKGLNSAKSTESVTLGEAIGRGLEPCSICAGG